MLLSPNLEPIPDGTVLARRSSAWSTFWRLVVVVVLMFMVSQGTVVIAFALMQGDPIAGLVAVILLVPFVLLLLHLRRPRLMHLIVAEPDPPVRWCILSEPNGCSPPQSRHVPCTTSRGCPLPWTCRAGASSGQHSVLQWALRWSPPWSLNGFQVCSSCSSSRRCRSGCSVSPLRSSDGGPSPRCARSPNRA